MLFVRELSEQDSEQMDEALRRWRDAAEVRRVRAVRLSSRGWPVPRIAEALDVTRTSVRRWIHLYEAEGLEGLRTKPRPGRPAKVDQQYRRLLVQVVETPPRELGYSFNRWMLAHLGLALHGQGDGSCALPLPSEAHSPRTGLCLQEAAS